jgi:hypothetical protein
MSERISRRDFLTVSAGTSAGLVALFTRGRANTEGRPEIPSDWLSDLQKRLGSDYILDKNILYFQDRDKPKHLVLMQIDNQGTFNEGPGEGGRETVVWAEGKHFYNIKGGLVAVSNQKEVFSYDTTGKFWGRTLGGDTIADYKYRKADDGGFLDIMVWDKQTLQQTPSGWSVELGSGDFIPVKK